MKLFSVWTSFSFPRSSGPDGGETRNYSRDKNVEEEKAQRVSASWFIHKQIRKHASDIKLVAKIVSYI